MGWLHRHAGVDIPLAAQPSAWRPEGGSWGPPPVKQSYAAELGEARHGAARRQRQPDALRSLSLSGEELAASWAAMGDPLRAEEVAALLDAHGADGGRLRAVVSTSGHACGRLLRVSSLVDAVLAEQFRGGGAGGGAAEALRTHHGIPAVPEDFRCRIKYRPARGTVLAPTRFDAAAALAASKVALGALCQPPIPSLALPPATAPSPSHAIPDDPGAAPTESVACVRARERQRESVMCAAGRGMGAQRVPALLSKVCGTAWNCLLRRIPVDTHGFGATVRYQDISVWQSGL